MSIDSQDLAEVRVEQLHNLGKCEPTDCEYCTEAELEMDKG